MPTRGRAAALSIALEEDIETYIVAPALRARQLRPWYCVIQGGAHPTKKPQGLRCGPELQPFGLTPYLTTSRNRAKEVTWPGGSGGEFVEVFDLGEGGAVHALDFGVAGLDEVVLVGRVGAIAVAQAEVAGGEMQRVS